MTSRALLAVVTLFLAGCTIAPQPGSNGSAMVTTESMESVVKRTFTTCGFRLQSGKTLPEMTLAFETYGRLAPDGGNAILITHGGTSTQHAAGKYSPTDREPGWWDGLIGPGKAIDTNKYFVVSSNVLGSSYGSTAPASINPATGKRYGPDFPEISMHDIVTAQRTLLRGLGVHQLVAVVGPSYGGYQAFQWAVSYPDDMSGIAAVITAPKGSGKEGGHPGAHRPLRQRSELERRLALRPRRHPGDDAGDAYRDADALRVERDPCREASDAGRSAMRKSAGAPGRGRRSSIRTLR